MKKIIAFIITNLCIINAFSQSNPAITGWLQNTSGILGRHYITGNTTPINDALEANIQKVQYSSNFVYVSTHGVPAYVTGPWKNTTIFYVGDQNAIYKFPLNPQKNTNAVGAKTTGGNIGVFINGVSLFDFRDGFAWNDATKTICGGPNANNACPGVAGTTYDWNRDAVLAEREGFDCNKAHPANGNYHHHQNPSAFKSDKKVLSEVCDPYLADGLYAIDSTKHSPLIGFAYDGFPIYGAYAYKNTNGTGGIVRIKSSYSLNTGNTRLLGPDVSTTYPLGYFREDYHYNATSANTPDYLDDHNGRVCVTPEYPNGIYCYFTTVDQNWNSTYPYAVGPTFYGTKTVTKVTTITESVIPYTPKVTAISKTDLENVQISVFPNPASDLIMIQLADLNKENLKVELFDFKGKLVASTSLLQGSTIAHFDTQILYDGQYLVKISNNENVVTKKVLISKD